MVRAKDFADDAALLLLDPDLPTLVSQGQEAMGRALDFGRANGLTFVAEKTEGVVFTWKQVEVQGVPKLGMSWVTSEATSSGCKSVRWRQGSRMHTEIFPRVMASLSTGIPVGGRLCEMLYQWQPHLQLSRGVATLSMMEGLV